MPMEMFFLGFVCGAGVILVVLIAYAHQGR
jgi:hypothetical protein